MATIKESSGNGLGLWKGRQTPTSLTTRRAKVWVKQRWPALVVFPLLGIYTLFPLFDLLINYGGDSSPWFRALPPIVAHIISGIVYSSVHLLIAKRRGRRCVPLSDVIHHFGWESFQFIVSVFGCVSYIMYTYAVDPVPIHADGGRFIGYLLTGWFGNPFGYSGFEFLVVSDCCCYRSPWSLERLHTVAVRPPCMELI